MSVTAAPDAVAIVREAFEAYREAFRAFTVRARVREDVGGLLHAQTAEKAELVWAARSPPMQRCALWCSSR